MERKCINCKNYANRKCYSDDFARLVQVEEELKGSKYIEQGLFEEDLKDRLDVKQLVNLVIDELNSQDYIKKNRNIDKFDYENSNLEDNIIENIHESVSSQIESFFDCVSDSSIMIDEPRELSCCYWE